MSCHIGIGTPLLDDEIQANLATKLDEYIKREVGAALIDDAKKIRNSLKTL